MLGEYQPEWLQRDVIAGLVLSTLLVPQGMAYAELAGLPAKTANWFRSTPHPPARLSRLPSQHEREAATAATRR